MVGCLSLIVVMSDSEDTRTFSEAGVATERIGVCCDSWWPRRENRLRRFSTVRSSISYSLLVCRASGLPKEEVPCIMGP